MTITTSDDVLAYLDQLGVPDVSICMIGEQIKASGGPLGEIGAALARRGPTLRRLSLKRAILALRHDDRAEDVAADPLAETETLYVMLGRAIRDARRAWLQIGYVDDVTEAAVL